MMKTEIEEGYLSGHSWGVRSLLETLEWDHAGNEVEQEHRARIILTGVPGAGKSALLNRLRGMPVSARNGGEATREDLGLFTLIDLPEDDRAAAGEQEAYPDYRTGFYDGYDMSYPLMGLSDADLIVFVLDGARLMGQEVLVPSIAEYRWLCRVRALCRPLVVVLTKADLLGEQRETAGAALKSRLGMPVLAVSTCEEASFCNDLLGFMLDACPQIALALGREMPEVRRFVASRLIREAAFKSALIGLEPLPLIDIAFLWLAQRKLILRLAALYSHPATGKSNRAVLASLAGGIGLRLAAQQAAKVVPLAGWAISGLLSGSGTWLTGWAAVAYFDGQWQQQHGGGQRLRLPVRTSLPARGLWTRIRSRFERR